MSSFPPGSCHAWRLVNCCIAGDSSKIWSHPKGWVEQHVRADQDTFRAEIEACGFRLQSEPSVPGLVENYVRPASVLFIVVLTFDGNDDWFWFQVMIFEPIY
jgi:hypothetical protein